MQRSDNLDLPYILPSQAQKHVTHNEAIRALDAVVQLSVLDRDRIAPPDDPAGGSRHIVAKGAVEDWQDRAGAIAAWQDGAWMFYAPQPGWLAYVAAERRFLSWDGAAWVFAAGEAPEVLRLAIGGAQADGYNRLAVQAAASLFTHEGVGHRLAINKRGSSDTAALLLQSGFSGRAEIGLCGDNRLHLKVSRDGGSWREALVADADGGLACGGPLRLAAYASGSLPGATTAGALVFVSDLATVAFSDGASWRRIGDGAEIGA